MGGSHSEDTIRERVGGTFSRYRLYVQLNVNRLVLTAILAVGLFAVLLALGVWDGTPLRAVMRSADPTDTLFQAYVTSIITGVTLVVTIDQLVLSQELGPLGDQEQRMSGAMDFREDVEEHLGSVSPPEPSSFLKALVDASGEKARELRDAVSDNRNEEFVDETIEFLDDLSENAESVSDDLENSQFGQYQVVKSALDFNYSWKIYRARRLRHDYADDLYEREEDAFDELLDVLTFFAPAREHIKTLYFQWELVELSRGILYVSIPALAVAVAMLVFFDASSFPGAFLGVDNVLWVVCLAVTFCSLPFLLLATYILRLATIARRTLAIGPFVLRQSGREDDLDWES